eukprot:m.213907 g.213907  ORF g.213907 m.213907 type:complete len:56 (+) comp17182_c0_seq1:255-422(+)
MDRWNVSDEPIFEPPPKAPRRYPSSLPCFESFDFNLYPLSSETVDHQCPQIKALS